MTTAALERPQAESPLRARYQLVIDLDGTLIDMEPFAAELDGERDQWCRFFDNTANAKPAAEGLAFVAALRRIGWRCSISTTRPRAVRGRDGKTFIPQLPPIRAWVRANLPAQPRWVYMRVAADTGTTVVDVKRGHFLATAEPPKTEMKALPGVLMVDDELAVVDELVDRGVPALHISDLAGTSDSELEGLLAYGAAQAVAMHRAHAEELAFAGV
jgi:hypothetical protein